MPAPLPWWSLPFILPVIAVARLRYRLRARRMRPVLDRVYYVGQSATIKTCAHRQRYFNVSNGDVVTVVRWGPDPEARGHVVGVETRDGRILEFPGGHVVADKVKEP